MTPESPSYHHGDLARALLDSLTELVAERGVDGVTLRETARRAGVSHSAPAHHFGDLDGMLDAMALEGFERLGIRMNESIAAAAVTASGPLDYLDALGRAYLLFAVSHRPHYQVMFRSKETDDEFDDTPLGMAANGVFGPLAVIVGELIAGGLVPAERGRYVATMMWSVVHGFADLWNDGILRHFYEDHTIDELIGGLTSTIRLLISPN